LALIKSRGVWSPLTMAAIRRWFRLPHLR
jgi:hypothetical protein